MKINNSQKISTFALVLLITGAIDSIRNLPTTAMFGTTLLFFFILAALFFLIPVALVSAELSSTWADKEGGIYYWLEMAFGQKLAFFGIWLQWINTLVWYPTILSFIAGTLAYLFEPSLAQDKYYLITMIIVIFWVMTLINLLGLKTSATFASFCAIVGMIVPMVFIILLAIIWMIKGHPVQLHFTSRNIFPSNLHAKSWVSLTAMMTAFLGMELAAVHVRQVKSPQKNFPRAMFFSVILILTTMILGSLAIAFVLPQSEIHLVDGVMQAFKNFFAVYHLEFLLPVLVVLLLIGSIGGLINWIISPAKGILLAAKQGFFPKALTKVNRHGVASRILILQAVVVTILSTAYLMHPKIKSVYWLYTDLSTELYMMMYVLMFLAALRLKNMFKDKPRPFTVPLGKFGFYLTCVMGLIGCLVTIYVGFITPDENLHIADGINYTWLFSKTLFFLLSPILLFYGYKQLIHKETGQ